jgi:hypothetical protein
MTPDLKDSLDAEAFATACAAFGSDVDPERLRVAIDAYCGDLHLAIHHVHASVELTPEEVLDAFRPKTVEI